MTSSTSLKAHPTKITKTKLILSVNLLILRFFYQHHHYCLPHLPCRLISSTAFSSAITGHQVLEYNNTSNTPLLAQNSCDFSKLISLLRNLTINDYILVSKKYMNNLPCNSQYPSRNHVLFSLTSTILIHQNTYFKFWSLM